MKVFVTGVTGQLGYECVKELLKRGHIAVGSGGRSWKSVDRKLFAAEAGAQLGQEGVNELEPRGRDSAVPDRQALCGGTAANSFTAINAPYVQLDITDKDAVYNTITEIKPDVVIHCAAWTNVDGAESPGNQEKVHLINAVGTENIARAARAVDAKMVYISTDYVFGGKGERPWKADDICYAPLNVYGQSKMDGELAVKGVLEKYFIVRVSWLFGLNGKNFIKTMINAGKTHNMVRVVNDQIGAPTYALDLARLLADMIETDKYGCYHAANEGGYISWYDFCVEFYRQYGLSTRVVPVTTAEYGLSAAARPFNSRLATEKLSEAGFKPLPVWQDAIKRYLQEARL